MNETFLELKSLGGRFDKVMGELINTWNSPLSLMGGDSNDVKEAGPYLERFIEDIENLHDNLISDRESLVNYIKSTDEAVSAAEKCCQDLKQQFDDVETVLCEIGYQPLRLDSERLPVDESQTESSILTESQMDHSQSPFSDDYHNKTETDLFCTPTINANRPKSIATPVITSLAAAKKSLASSGTDRTALAKQCLIKSGKLRPSPL